jgi:heat shock protein HtpX
MPPKRPFDLSVKMMLVVGVFFAIVWTATIAIVSAAGGDALYWPIIITVLFVGLQYLAAPWIVGWTMRVRYVLPDEERRLHEMVRELAEAARIPMPKVGISELEIPNAFAFGRWRSDGRVVVTRPLLKLLDEHELRAVLGHEIMHLRNRDVAVITFLSMLPNIFYYLFRLGIRMRGRNNPGPIVALVSILVYFVLQLLVLYASRIREYAADEGSVKLGNPPHWMASALYKLVYGAARLPPDELKAAAGFKAFFASDPNHATAEVRSLAELDLDRSGSIEPEELDALRRSKARPGAGAKAMELFGTHPNMLKRVQRLAELQAQGAFRVQTPYAG